MIILIFTYLLSYEVYLFRINEFSILAYPIKLIVPILLLILYKPKIDNNNKVFYYLFFGLILCGILHLIILGSVEELIGLYKLTALFAFALACSNRNFQDLIASKLPNLILLFGVFTLLQYICVYLNYLGPNFVFLDGMTKRWVSGPFGVFGCIQSAYQLELIDFPIYRLYGFFPEPSNASAYLGVCMVLCYFKYQKEKKVLWIILTLSFLFGIFACLSNAGYFALGVTLLLYYSRKNHSATKNFLLTLLGTSIIIYAVFGRSIIVSNQFENEILYTLSGVREYSYYTEFDSFGGRTVLANNAFKLTSNNIIGIGMSQTTIADKGISASGPIFWLTIFGLPGFIIIICKELHLLYSGLFKLKRLLAPELFYAAIFYMSQNMVYGTLINPLYLFLVMTFYCRNRNNNPNQEIYT